MSSDNNDKHLLISQVKELTEELGYVPTFDQFMNKYKGGGKVRRLFKNWNGLLEAADIPRQGSGGPTRKKLSNEIFERDIEEVLREHVPLIMPENVTYERTLIIGDTHFPFVNHAKLEKVYRFAEKEKPKRIIQIGDLFDLYAHSKFPRSLNIYSPEEETNLAREGAELMWKTLRSLCPDAECVQLKGNHDIRPLRQTLAHLPALEHVVSKYLNELMTFEGVKLIEDSRQEYEAQGILYYHGYRTGLGAHRDYVLQNSVVGHTHKGGVTFRRFRNQVCWELNAGFLGDAESKVFGYTPQKIHDCTNGIGFIDHWGPRFIIL